jgi:hypothetical protein
MAVLRQTLGRTYQLKLLCNPDSRHPKYEADLGKEAHHEIGHALVQIEEIFNVKTSLSMRECGA